MLSVVRWIIRLGGSFSANIINFIYFIKNGFLFSVDTCQICGLPIANNGKLNTIWADAEVLNFVDSNEYIYPICKYCRKTKPWSEIHNAYLRYWETLLIPVNFTWEDIELALELDRRKNKVPGDLKFWKETIKKFYNNCSFKSEFEFCGFKAGFEKEEVIKAAEILSKKHHGIYIRKTPERTSIIFNKYGKKEQRKRVIILPGKIGR